MPSNEDRSVSDVLRDILGNLQDIVRSEVRLAKAEFKTETGHAANAAKPLIAGAVLSLYAGGLLLLANSFLVRCGRMRFWGSPLGVACCPRSRE